MKKKVKLIALAVAVAVCAVLAAVSALMPLVVEVTEIRPGDVALTFTEQGGYGYETRLLVYPIVSGEVLEVRVREGDTVLAGQVLAVVDASDYFYQIEQLNSAIRGYNGQLSNLTLAEQQQRDSLAATLEGLNGQLSALETEMARSQTGEESLEFQVEIQESIIDANRSNAYYARRELRDARDYGDDEEIDLAQQAHNNAQAVLHQSELALEQLKSGKAPENAFEGQKQSLQAQIGLIREQLGKSYAGGMRQYYAAQIEAAQAGISQMEQKAGKAEITAPIAGVVSELPVRGQNLVSSQSQVAVIGTGGRVEVFVPIREIDGVKLGDTVELILDKRLEKQVIPGTVIQVDKEAQVKLSALGVEERKVRVLIRPDQPGFAIGYDMDARFTVYTRENALVVPKTAVFQIEDDDWVWVIQDGALARRKIQKSIETREGYIVEDGLEDGAQVVTDADSAELREGRSAQGQTD